VRATPPHPIVPIDFSTELPELIQFKMKACTALTREKFSEKLTALVVTLLAEGRFAGAALVDRAAGLVHVF
jgi:hypothetical protein